MTDDEARALGLRALGRKALDAGYRWAPGVLTMDGDRVDEVWYRNPDERGTVKDLRALPPDSVIYAYHIAGTIDTAEILPDELGEPDFSDSATLGTLISQVQERYGGFIVISLGSGWWSIETDANTWDNDNTGSPIDALVAALEAAPASPPE